MITKDDNDTFELKIIADTNIEAIKTIEKLFPDFQFKELKISNNYDFQRSNVYTITISHAEKLVNTKEN